MKDIGNTERDAFRLRSLLSAMPAVDACAVKQVAADLAIHLGDVPVGKPPIVLVAYGGGKDSSYTVSFVRAVQLYADVVLARPFKLRVATNRHAGMPSAVMENISRVYNALGMARDESVECLVIDGDAVKPFAVNLPLPIQLIERNRNDILMNGHRSVGEARPTFCNTCNLSMVNSFGVAAAWGDGVDAIITGDSRVEQKSYLVWTRRLARDLGGTVTRGTPGLEGFLRTMDSIARGYYGEIHGDSAAESRGVAHILPRAARFFSIYGYTAYDVGSHWNFLTEFLDFRFDELAFSFTESDCANPLLMAHFRGLRAERVHGRQYAEGVIEYRDYALGLMVRKEFPSSLVEAMTARYQDEANIDRMRGLANGFARDAYGLTEAQIVCMLWAPFGEQGRRLRPWLTREAPHLLAEEDIIRCRLGGDGAGVSDLPAELLNLSGLRAQQIRALWGRVVMPNLASTDPSSTPLGRILKDDPHKATIVTRHAPDGPEVVEVITGR